LGSVRRDRYLRNLTPGFTGGCAVTFGSNGGGDAIGSFEDGV